MLEKSNQRTPLRHGEASPAMQASPSDYLSMGLAEEGRTKEAEEQWTLRQYIKLGVAVVLLTLFGWALGRLIAASVASKPTQRTGAEKLVQIRDEVLKNVPNDLNQRLNLDHPIFAEQKKGQYAKGKVGSRSVGEILENLPGNFTPGNESGPIRDILDGRDNETRWERGERGLPSKRGQGKYDREKVKELLKGKKESRENAKDILKKAKEYFSSVSPSPTPEGEGGQIGQSSSVFPPTSSSVAPPASSSVAPPTTTEAPTTAPSPAPSIVLPTNPPTTTPPTPPPDFTRAQWQAECNNAVFPVEADCQFDTTGRYLYSVDETCTPSATAIACCGNFFLLRSPTATSSSYPNLKYALDMFHTGNSKLTTIDFPELEYVRQFFVVNNSLLTNVNFPKLKEAQSFFALALNPKIQSLTFPEVTAVVSAPLEISDNGILFAASFPKLRSVEILTVARNPLLDSALFPKLETTAGDLQIENNPVLRAVNLGNVIRVEGSLTVRSGVNGLTSCVFGNATTCVIQECCRLTTCSVDPICQVQSGTGTEGGVLNAGNICGAPPAWFPTCSGSG